MAEIKDRIVSLRNEKKYNAKSISRRIKHIS